MRRITAQLKRNKENINKKKVARLMRLMGIEAICPKKNLSKPNKEHLVYPYLLNEINVSYPNQIWGTDITYIKVRKSFVYLVAILDWYSRYVVSWRLSENMEKEFCIDCLKNAFKKAIPKIHNSDQGSQFTTNKYLNLLKKKDIKISMDSKRRCFDNIFTERLWRTVKYEEVYLNDYENKDQAEELLSKYFRKYNTKRLHQSLDYQTPAEVYFK